MGTRRTGSGGLSNRGFRLGGAVTAVLAIVAVASLIPVGASAAPTSAAVRPLAPTHAPYATDDWPTYLQSISRHSAAVNQSLINVSSVTSLKKIWNFSTGLPIATEPVEAGGRIVFGSWNGYEYALNSTNGSLLWKTYLGTTVCGRHGAVYGISSSATISTNNTVYVGGGGPYWYALNVRTGAVLWDVFTGNNSAFNVSQGGHYNWASPLIYGGYAYVGIASACDNPLVVGGLWKISLTTHQVVGYFNTSNLSRLGSSVWASPTYDTNRGIVYIATGNYYNTKNDQNSWNYDDSLIGVNASTLKPVLHWHVPVGEDIPDGDFGATPTLFQTDSGKPMVGSTNKDGRFFAFNRYNFSMGSPPVWQLQVSNDYNSVAPAAYDGTNLYIGAAGGSVIAGGHSPNGNVTNGTAENGSLWSVNATTGVPNWDDVFTGEVFGAPVYDNGVIFAAGGTNFKAINAATGAVLWDFHAPAVFYGAASIANNTVYIGNCDGQVYAFAIHLHHKKGGPILLNGPISVLGAPSGSVFAATPRPVAPLVTSAPTWTLGR